MTLAATDGSLYHALSRVPDHRKARGKVYPLTALLTFAATAMLCGSRSLYAIAQWGRDQERGFLVLLGLTRAKSPCVATLHRVFTKLDPDAFEGALRHWADSNLPAGEAAIAVDGKTLRGIHGEELPGVVLIAAYEHSAGLVLGQKGGEGR